MDAITVEFLMHILLIAKDNLNKVSHWFHSTYLNVIEEGGNILPLLLFIFP